MRNSRSRFTGLFRSVRAAPTALFTRGRLAPLPLLLIGLAVLAAVALIFGDSWIAHAQTNNDATGRPVILASAEGAGILFADTEDIADGNGLPIDTVNTYATFTWTYQWIRVDGNSETNVGANSASYQPVKADVGNLIKVKVSFTDGDNFSEAVTSLPFGPIAELAGPSRPATTLVSNTGQSPSSTANITQQYALGFKLGDHGQGYDISSVSIDLAAVPSNLTVSLWSGSVGFQGVFQANTASKLFDFANPSSFAVGLNEVHGSGGRVRVPERQLLRRAVGFRRLAVDQGDDVGRRGRGWRDGGRHLQQRGRPSVERHWTMGNFRLARRRAALGRRGLAAGPRHPRCELRPTP